MPIDLATVKYLLPELLLVVLAVCVFIGGTWNRTKLGWSTLAVVAFGFGALLLLQQPVAATLVPGTRAVLTDPLSHGLRLVALLLGGLFCVFSTQSGQQKLYPELLGSLVLVFVGLMLVGSAGDLVLLFLGLELISIPTYVLLFIGRDSRASHEASAKYFFLSILSSAMLLYGFASLYGLAGEINLDMIQASLHGPEPTAFPMFYPIAVGLIVVGFCFKIAAVPFHFYAPDVYQATTNMNAALLAVVPKIAGVVGLVRVLVVALPHESDFAWRLILVLSVLTMTLGNVSALWQVNLRRMLAYSSIAHAGYLLLGLAAAVGAGPGAEFGEAAVAAMLFYVVAYAVATVAAFAAVAYLSDDDESFSTLDQLAGIGRRYPMMAGAIALAMFSLAGIPPLAGFWGKFGLFRSALDAGLSAAGHPDRWFLALCVIGVVNAAIAAGYYLRVVSVLYSSSANTDADADPVLGNAGAGLTALLAALLVMGVGVLTGPAMQAAQSAAAGLWPEGNAAQVAGRESAPGEHKDERRAAGTATDHDLIVGPREYNEVMARLPNRRKAASQALDQAAQPIYLLDESRRIIYCNAACLQWLGVSEEQLLGQTVDYCANPLGELAVWGGLCPPPQAFGGEPTEGSVWVSPDHVTLICHRARFLALSALEGASGSLIAVVGRRLDDDEASMSQTPTKDASRLHQQLLRYAADVAPPLRIDPLVGTSAAIRLARTQVRLAAEHVDRVLIVGPRGAGHEAVARSIHQGHRRGANRRLFPLDCTLLDADLLQTTIAAFIRRTAELAEQGAATLLLLDVDQLSPAAQAKLLEIMSDKSYPLRTVATAVPTLPPRPAFRHELAALLSTLTIRLPALTERLEDLPLLIQSVVERSNQGGLQQIAGVSPGALDQLLNYPWRGNLDELASLLREAREGCPSPIIGVPELPPRISLSAEAERFPVVPSETIQLDDYLGRIERELIERSLRVAAGNRAQAARLLGISRARLLRRLESLGLDEEQTDR